jgi:gliding motility associated protien GldN
MKKSSFVIFLFVSFLSINNIMAQANLLNARVPQEVGKLNDQQIAANDEDPLPYGFIDDRDVLWSKTIWEKIDLDERINFPYYFPSEAGNLGEERRSLFDVLIQGIEEGKIKEVYFDDGGYFRTKLTYQQVLEKLNFVFDTPQYTEAINSGVTDPEILAEYQVPVETTSADVLEYRIKGTWYFDKRQGEMKYRLLGIAPCATDLQFKNPDPSAAPPGDPNETYPLFWVWFPDAREVLNEAYVFNTRNSSQPIAFDHMLNSRRFNAVIYKEENVYQDRKVDEYIYEDALQQLLESERIKSVIRDFEQDMWSN